MLIVGWELVGVEINKVRNKVRYKRNKRDR